MDGEVHNLGILAEPRGALSACVGCACADGLPRHASATPRPAPTAPPEGGARRWLMRGAPRETGNRAARIPRSRQWTDRLEESGWWPLLDPLLRDWLIFYPQASARSRPLCVRQSSHPSAGLTVERPRADCGGVRLPDCGFFLLSKPPLVPLSGTGGGFFAFGVFSLKSPLGPPALSRPAPRP